MHYYPSMGCVRAWHGRGAPIDSLSSDSPFSARRSTPPRLEPRPLKLRTRRCVRSELGGPIADVCVPSSHRIAPLYRSINLTSRLLALQLSQSLLERDQEVSSLQHKLSLAESELDKSESKVKELKGAAEEGDSHRTTGENLARKVQLLEEELDKAEKDLKDTTEK